VSVEVRRATLEDVPAVAPMFDAYRVFYGQEPDPELASRFLRERLERAESVVFLALDGEAGRASGFTQLYPLFSSVAARRKWLLNDLFVASEARVRGAGGALVEAARRFAAETGAKGLELATAPDNVAAQRLYEATGWKRDAFLHYSLDV
jgi:ribosomal protein S18 acetylase RimI-like enzyme